MKLLLLVFVLNQFNQLIDSTKLPVPSSQLTPVAKIKLPKRIHDVSYKGSLFSYTSNGKNVGRPIRDFILESESIKLLEDTFVDHLTETILSKLSSQMKTGVPTMGIPSLDPLRLKPIKVEPIIGSDAFTIHMNDIEVHGLSDVDIQDLRPKLNALKVRIALLFPKLTTDCHFSVNGTVYNVVDVKGEGSARLEYSDVLVRTQLNLVYENSTLQIGSSDPPLVDFSSARIKLSKNEILNSTTEAGVASELGPLLFWVLADHIVQEVDDFLLKYVNNNMLLFKVPESFSPVVTWLMNRSGNPSHMMPPFGRFSPLPFLNQWFNSLSNFRPHISVHPHVFK